MLAGVEGVRPMAVSLSYSVYKDMDSIWKKQIWCLAQSAIPLTSRSIQSRRSQYKGTKGCLLPLKQHHMLASQDITRLAKAWHQWLSWYLIGWYLQIPNGPFFDGLGPILRSMCMNDLRIYHFLVTVLIRLSPATTGRLARVNIPVTIRCFTSMLLALSRTKLSALR